MTTHAAVPLTPPALPPLLAEPARPGRLSRWSTLIVLLYGATLLGIGLGGGTRVLTHHEVLAAQPAREMLRDGHWLIPTFVGVPRTTKPPTAGWFIALSMAAFGSDAEWVVRLPAVVSGVLLAWMIAALTARWYGNRWGLLAGLMQLTCFYVPLQARLAEADMPLVTAVAAAMTLFALANVDHPAGRLKPRWLPWAFYAATGVVFLIKGPVGLLFIFSACLLFALWSRDVQALRFLVSPMGLCILLAMLIAWPLASYLAYPQILQSWIEELFGYAAGTFGRDPWYFYAGAIPLLVLPWTFLILLGGLYAAVRSGIARDVRALNRLSVSPLRAFVPLCLRASGFRPNPHSRFLTPPLVRFAICWLLPGMLILSAVRYKSQHYAFPLLPPLTILAVEGLMVWLRRQYRNPRPRHGLTAVLLLVGSALAIAGLFVAVRRKPDLPIPVPAIAALIAVFALGGLAVTYAEHRRWLTAELAALFVTAWLVIVGVHVLVVPHYDGYRPRAELAWAANRAVPAGQTICLVDLGENHVAYYLRPPILRLDDPAKVPGELAAAGQAGMYLFAPRPLLARLSQWGTVEQLDEVAMRVSGKKDPEGLLFLRLTPSATTAPAVVASPASAPARP